MLILKSQKISMILKLILSSSFFLKIDFDIPDPKIQFPEYQVQHKAPDDWWVKDFLTMLT